MVLRLTSNKLNVATRDMRVLGILFHPGAFLLIETAGLGCQYRESESVCVCSKQHKYNGTVIIHGTHQEQEEGRAD
jgi:hypothetical protein